MEKEASMEPGFLKPGNLVVAKVTLAQQIGFNGARLPEARKLDHVCGTSPHPS